MNKQDPIDIIIPTFDNYYQLNQCLESLYISSIMQPIRVIVVNNGEAKLDNLTKTYKDFSIEVINAESNLGWIGGLKRGLEESKSKYVCFVNDDIFIPRSSIKWLSEMARTLAQNDKIGAVGPSSNVVMGIQNIWHNAPYPVAIAPFLVGFCILVSREALDAAGGVQDMEYGGDDIDLSIRLRKAGYRLIIRKDIFVFHHGFQTGNRIHGGPEEHNGWNSRSMTDNVTMELIGKHGFLSWWETMIPNALMFPVDKEVDAEGDIVRSMLNGEKNVVELGCGSTKTVDYAIGVDVTPKGESNPYISGVSVADVVANVEKELPFDNKSIDCIIARHVLEHTTDLVSTLKLWKSKLKDSGKLIISVPDERLYDSIPMNPEHKHAFTPEGLIELAELVGFKGKKLADGYNSLSFTLELENV